MTGIQRVSTREMEREDWLERRRGSIGGSDAAAIVGLSKWGSPFSVWCDKTGHLPPKEDTEAMRQGRDLEEYVARRWSEQTGRRVRRVQAILYNPRYPFAHADVDRMLCGVNEGLECKTTSSLNLRPFRGVEFPEQYYAQCVHYMAVTGAERWHLAVLVFGREFFTFTLERDQAEIDALMRAEEDFWNLVKSGSPPPVDGAPATGESLHSIYPVSRRETAALFGRDALLREYLDLRERKKKLDLRIGEIENTIKAELGEAEAGRSRLYSVSWKTQTRRTFQARDFARDHPELDLSPYYKTTTLRPFKVTEQEKEAV